MSQRVHTYRRISLYIDEETCTACKLCYDTLPEVFSDRGDGIPIVLTRNIREDLLVDIEQVARDCPSNYIILGVG